MKSRVWFLRAIVYTRVQTPRRCGEPLSAGVLVFVVFSARPRRTSYELLALDFHS